MRNAILFSVSSDIGFYFCKRLLQEGFRVYGTYKTFSNNVQELKNLNVNLYQCDLLDDEALYKTMKEIKKDADVWDCLCLLQASMNPIGKLTDVDMDEWETSIRLNFINQIKTIQFFLTTGSKERVPSVITFAGGGTNGATKDYSAYTISKIALIKMMELLAVEYEDVKFVSVGPGWVKTKIHNETLAAKELAEEAYQSTVEHIKNNEFTSMDQVVDCLLWVIEADKEIVNGRNFSVVYDNWGALSLSEELRENDDMYKLRRFRNN